MKNIYELSKQDKDKYRDEFNKLKFTKDVNIIRAPSLFIAIVAAFTSGFLSGLAEDVAKLQTWSDYAGMVAILALILFSILEVYLNISFIRWMKIKHNIEY